MMDELIESPQVSQSHSDAFAEMCELAWRQVTERSRRSNGWFGAPVTGRLWPGPEILTIKLIAEKPFDSTWDEKFRCNRHGRLMADRVSMALCQEAGVRRNHEFFNGRNAARTPLSAVGHNRPVKNLSQTSHTETLSCMLND